MTKLSMVVPTSTDVQLALLHKMEKYAIARAGGCSTYSGVGSWVDGKDRTIRETHGLVVVLTTEAKAWKLVADFKLAAYKAGEEAVCYELQDVDANIVTVRESA